MTHLAQPVSIFQGSTRVIPVETVSLHTVLDRIQDGTYRPYVERLRTILASQDQDAYSAAKRHSTAFTPAGTFTQRNNASVITLSGCLNFDMDHVPNLDDARSLLGADPHLLYLFVSPSGRGAEARLYGERLHRCRHVSPCLVGRRALPGCNLPRPGRQQRPRLQRCLPALRHEL